MKMIITVSIITFLLCSCIDYSSISSVKRSNANIVLQDFYSPCCGSCGQRILIDSLKGDIYALQVNCFIEDEYSRLCTPLSLGTHKKILIYKKNKIIAEKYYKPVYDTMELKKMYPKVERGEYYDSILYSKPISGLTSIDSSLINYYYSLTKKENCSDKYLRLIKGFILVKEIKDKNSITDKRKPDF